jgi:AcrR family transcriptional regulator
LEAAGFAFARKGFRDTKVAEICQSAGTNTAAVNYYFGSKEALYMESWKAAHEKSDVLYPPNGGIPSNAPPAERLRGQIESLVHFVLDESSYSIDIAYRELVNPTGLIHEMKHTVMRNLHLRFETIIRELLGECATERDIRFCERSVFAQCYGQLVLRRMRWQNLPHQNKHEEIRKQDRESYARHVYDFSLAGIREIKRQIDARTGEGK